MITLLVSSGTSQLTKLLAWKSLAYDQRFDRDKNRKPLLPLNIIMLAGHHWPIVR